MVGNMSSRGLVVKMAARIVSARSYLTMGQWPIRRWWVSSTLVTRNSLGEREKSMTRMLDLDPRVAHLVRQSRLLVLVVVS